jgi:hypothetical protein
VHTRQVEHLDIGCTQADERIERRLLRAHCCLEVHPMPGVHELALRKITRDPECRVYPEHVGIERDADAFSVACSTVEFCDGVREYGSRAELNDVLVYWARAVRTLGSLASSAVRTPATTSLAGSDPPRASTAARCRIAD